jgi:hypothetical protein
VSAGGDLCRLERIIDASGVAAQIEGRLPIGVRPRQLSVRTLLLGMLAALSDKRPAHLARVHAALICLPEADKRRLGVIAQWKSGPHLLSYRQTERTFGLVNRALSKERPDGRPSQILSDLTDALIEGSVKALGVPESSSYAIDWSDYESFARPPHKDGRCEDAEGAWGHRKVNHPGRSDTFFGYYLQAATIVKEDNGGPEVAELVRRISLSSCKHDPPAQIVPALLRMASEGIEFHDLLADSGYSYREPETFAAPMRAAGAALVMDLHPNDRGMKGTHQGAVIANGNLYCPATPKTLFELCPPAPAATEQELQVHDRQSEELSRYKLSPLTAADPDGYRRACCPAAAGKLRCPLRPSSMTLSHERPTVISPPEHAPTFCEQQTITVPPAVNAKSAQKHDYPSQAQRHSYARRSAAERSFSQIHDPASNDIKRGWCRLMGLAPNTLFLACAFIIANVRLTDAFTARQAEDQRRAACGLEPRRRRRRRRTIHDLTDQAHAPPAKARLNA